MRDLDLFTGAAALGLSVVLDCTLIRCPPIEPQGGHVVLITFPTLWIWPPGQWQPLSWLLATHYNSLTSAAVPGQWEWWEGGVVHLLHHQARRAQPMLYGDFALLGCRAVGDHLFPWFLDSPAGSSVGPATTRGGELPCFLGRRAPVREASSPICYLGVGVRGSPAHCGVGWVGCCHKLRSSETSG